MKIVVAHFQAVTGVNGGMERILCDFSNAMTEFGHEVHLMVYDLQSGLPFYPLHDGVHLWNLRKFSGEPDRIPVRKKSAGKLHGLLVESRGSVPGMTIIGHPIFFRQRKNF